MERGDRLIQGMTVNGDFRVIAAETTTTVDTARQRLDLSPVAAEALGKAMTGAVLLARLLDKEVREQRVTLRFEGDGPLGTMIAEGTIAGTARGYVHNPRVASEELDGSSAVGANGTLTVVRGTPPAGSLYTSQIQLDTGGVARDIARYLAYSEQVHSAVVLGVLNRPHGVSAAGGLIVQAFPHVSGEAIESMERAIHESPSFSHLLDTMPIEDAVEKTLHGVGYKRLDPSFDVPLRFSCSCTRERALAPLQLFSQQEIAEMIQEDGSEVVCQYCGERYNFTGEELLALADLPDA